MQLLDRDSATVVCVNGLEHLLEANQVIGW